jgi:N-acetylneuraminic acid mutarotase
VKEGGVALIMLLVLSFALSTFSLPLVSATEDFWITMEPMPTARNGFGVAVVAGKIYVIGGSNGSLLGTNEMYDPVTDTWITKTSMPTPRIGFGIAVYQNKIYVIGGQIGLLPQAVTGANEVYDPSTDTWESKTAIPEGRSGFRANVVNDKIYLISGFGTPFTPYPNSDENLVYDPANDSWTTKAPIPTPVHWYASEVFDNKIYIIGGRDFSLNIIYNLTQIYDPKTDTWSYGASIPTNVSLGAAGATTGTMAPTRIYVIGGFTSFDYEAIHLNYIYDSEGDVWSMGTPMPTPRYSLGVEVVNDTLYAIGGKSRDSYLAVNEKYTPVGYIPEFPSSILPSLFLVATLAAILCKKKIRIASA